MARENEKHPPSVTTDLAIEQRQVSSVGSDRPWSLDDLPIAVLILHGNEVAAVNEEWTALTGLDLTASKGDGWLTAVPTRGSAWVSLVARAGRSAGMTPWRTGGS